MQVQIQLIGLGRIQQMPRRGNGLSFLLIVVVGQSQELLQVRLESFLGGNIVDLFPRRHGKEIRHVSPRQKVGKHLVLEFVGKQDDGTTQERVHGSIGPHGIAFGRESVFGLGQRRTLRSRATPGYGIGLRATTRRRRIVGMDASLIVGTTRVEPLTNLLSRQKGLSALPGSDHGEIVGLVGG